MALGTLVDSNVLLDLFTEDESWFEWSSNALARAADAGPLFVNPVIYAEVSVRFSRIERPRGRPPAIGLRAVGIAMGIGVPGRKGIR